MTTTKRLVPRLSIIEPQSVKAELANGLSRASVVTFSAGAGQAGGIGMRLRLFVRPMSVSFTHIKIEEVPRLTYRASGYFENPYFNGAFVHTTVAGAGNWLPVRPDNSFADDTAAYNDVIPWFPLMIGLSAQSILTHKPSYRSRLLHVLMKFYFGILK